MTTPANNLPLFPEWDTPAQGDTLFYEAVARRSGYGLIAGVDEAGRGPLAGPVVAAAVILRDGAPPEGVRDSKKMTEKAREKAFSVIHGGAVAVGIGVVSSRFIDRHNILKATLEAMRRAVSFLDPAPDFLLVDGISRIPVSTHQQCIKKGDQRSLSISAASVMAKVYRDRIMRNLHEAFPWYGFCENKGYGTARHLAVIRERGPCAIHRMTFRGVC